MTIRNHLTIVAVAACTALGGCNATRTMHQNDYADMMDIYDEKTSHSSAQSRVFKLRQAVETQYCADETRRGVDAGRLSAYTRNAANELDFLFKRLPNPTLYLYIDPHLTGAEGVPIPGYTTAFPMYERDHWALPDEAPVAQGVIGAPGYKTGQLGGQHE